MRKGDIYLNDRRTQKVAQYSHLKCRVKIGDIIERDFI